MTTPATTSQRPAHAFCLTKRRSYTSPHLVRTRSKNNTLCGVPGERDAPIASAPKTAPSAATASRLTRKTQSFSEGLEPPTGERIADVAVFLGGSCNPTTWRHDVAMPMLDAAHVHYFNPQVDEWFEELIQIEAKAKETAQIVLMVVDGLTRSIVCINEAVEYICRGRKVMLVVDDIEEGTEVAGKVLSKTELADLNGARQCLRDLAHRRGVGLFPDVAAAIEGCIAYLTQTNAPRSKPEVPRLRKRSSIVLNSWSGKHRPHRVTSRSHSSRLLKSNSSGSNKSITDDSEQSSDSPGVSSPSQSIVNQLGCQLFSDYTGGSVYLGGNLTATSWRQKVAIPLLRQAGIPVYVPFADYLQFGLSSTAEQHVQTLSEHFREIETQKATAELVLFVIPRNLRSIAAMTEAVELVSSHQALLLVIEPVEEGCMVEEGVAITGREFKDLARARAYLREMAERNDVAVFESVTQAVENIVERLE
ncbi:hypothetical protein PPTG_15971 [Phytophthora nicotianae INRA-310]|uniref:Uncharacterized protein n=2 Tax=Phytophthora nicotianae TaxID=4792 RepID=W2PT39_PHYN3|nr:hypothetical protein PPTG_15971 [Phytophthora nicotianae INRA-310]ETN03776.1 hypothetical protein PPTG_15971 [Phytophthora nicotianae INRA-310]ETO67875.1 hypothetical protein F444_15241 [Phytophthora nicotianae P1976]